MRLILAVLLLLLPITSQAIEPTFVCDGASVQRGYSGTIARSRVQIVPSTPQPTIRDLTPLTPPLARATSPPRSSAPAQSDAPQALPAPAASEDIWLGVSLNARYGANDPGQKIKLGLFKRYKGGPRDRASSYGSWQVYRPASNGTYTHWFALPRNSPAKRESDIRLANWANQKYFPTKTEIPSDVLFTSK